MDATRHAVTASSARRLSFAAGRIGARVERLPFRGGRRCRATRSTTSASAWGGIASFPSRRCARCRDSPRQRVRGAPRLGGGAGVRLLAQRRGRRSRLRAAVGRRRGGRWSARAGPPSCVRWGEVVPRPQYPSRDGDHDARRPGERPDHGSAGAGPRSTVPAARRARRRAGPPRAGMPAPRRFCAAQAVQPRRAPRRGPVRRDRARRRAASGWCLRQDATCLPPCARWASTSRRLARESVVPTAPLARPSVSAISS